jgi:predicted glycogen debranching enzyme
MFEQLVTVDKTLELTTCAFAGHEGETFAPAGHDILSRFERGLHIAWTYTAGSITIKRELFLHFKQQAATLRYTIKGLDGKATLRLSPMLTLRDFHSLLRQKDGASFKTVKNGDAITVCRDDAAVTLQCGGAKFAPAKPTDQWWYDVHYAIDAERGQDDLEDYFLPGAFEIELVGDGQVLFTVALGSKPAKAQPSTKERAAHLAPMADNLGGDRALAIAADDFIVDRTIKGQTLSTILAGYPWFADWGRDTFISLPGLLLATGRHDEARDTLRTYALAIKDGLVPNRFDDYSDNVHYNTLDASLWFIHAAMEYRDAAGDDDSWNDWLCPAILQVIDAYLHGTKVDDTEIRMAGDGLITAGDSSTQLTWMDAKHGNTVFTPRQGKAVEINGLWYHALLGMSEKLADNDKRRSEHFKKLGGRIRRAFAKVFWDDQLGYMRDHVWIDSEGNEVADRSMRPNQIFVAAMPNSPMPRTKLTIMLGKVKEKLLTPVGLLTLPQDDRHYHAKYTGPQSQRDEAYHQGTIWPWLIGPYAEAVLRVGRFSDESKKEARAAVDPLLTYLNGEGLGQLHEIHEASGPRRPVGCMAQAWSIAQIIRVLKLIKD